MLEELSKKTFEDFYLSSEMLQALEAVSYIQPTPAQVASIPLILAGIDLIIQAQTGSGKTAAFAIPTIEMLEPHPGRVEVLVLAPTRELAKQVCEEFGRLGRFKTFEATAIYGGTAYEPQFEALKTAQIVCATPGRLIDLLKRGNIDLSRLRILCLDEADEMLSMGFRDEIEAVMEFLPEERQSLLFSATITDEIKSLANRILFYPEFISLSTDSVAATDVSHGFYNVRGIGRPRDLIKVLEYEEPESALIFANTKDDTFMLTTFLKRHGYRADVLNGDLPQKEREKTLAALRAGKIDYIVATDVAARGIDISDLSHVFNYVLPESAEVYIHRTGRTGRAGKKGIAISLIAPPEVATLFQVRRLYDVDLEQRELPTTQDIMTARQERALARLDRRIEEHGHVPYGAKLGIAQQLLSVSPNGDDHMGRVKLIARLLALAEETIEPRLNGRAPEPVAAEDAPIQETVVKETTTVEPILEEELAEAHEAVVEEPVVTEEVVREERPRSSRSRGRGRRRETTREDREESPVQPSTAAPAESGEARSGPRRTRTRRDAAPREEPPSPTPTPTTRAPQLSASGAVRETTDEPTRKMYVNVGRDQFDHAHEFLDMVCFMAGMDPEDFGDVELENSFSYIHVRKDYFSDVLAAVNGQPWKDTVLTAEPARK
ncbi:MAG: DEAD/DEAH box helicase [Bradymonadaceae bacterium]